MTPEEFLINMWNKCIWLSHKDYPGDILMVYDPIYLRKKKLNTLDNSDDDINFIKSNDSVILFLQEHENGHLCVNYTEIWYILKTKYGLKSIEINKLIIDTLLVDNKLNLVKLFDPDNYLFLEDDKLTKLKY